MNKFKQRYHRKMYKGYQISVSDSELYYKIRNDYFNLECDFFLFMNKNLYKLSLLFKRYKLSYLINH